jgi:hypothetical protein
MAAVTNQNNPSPNSNLTAEGQFRGIMAYPEIDLFYELLMDRVQMVLSQFFLEKPFTVFITALPRNHEEGTILRTPRLGDYTLIYAGISRQRDLLGAPENPSPKLWECWDKLSATRKSKMRSNDPSMASPAMGELNTESAPITSQLIDRYQNKQFKLEVIEGLGMGTLTNYFATRDAPYQEEEFQVLSAYFDIGQYRYLSVPLIQFSEFDGVVHIIYHQEEHSRFKDEKSGEFKKRAVGNVIKAISREYEGIILDWQVVGGNLTKRSALKDAINLAHASERARENVILSELDYGGYYEKHSAYIESRIDLNDKIPDIILAQYHRIATMQILIDSYTHNISAHSLVALEGWYKQRALYHGSRKTRLDVLDLPLIREERSFDHETHQFVRFMLDKGAFWTGLTRDYSFGGKTNSLYSVLWHDFVNNPLYLGTIAYTEGILKLNINITFLGEAKKSGEDVILRKEVLADGTWASIDLRKFRETIQEGKDMQTENEHDYLSGFITKGPSFNDLSSRLRECKSYFPGGVVGRHAFFTILENEIRNVKHYSIEVLESMQDDGLTLNISIEKENYHRGSSEVPEYYKIGVWLKHPVDVTHKMITDRLGWLEGKIINENHNPRLGGAFQDKVCAAMLFNNSFVSVQDRETERDKRFYPWIKVGFSKEDQGEPARFIEDWEISVRRYYWEKAATESERNAFRRSRAYFDQNFEKESGVLQEVFPHLAR